MIAVGTVFAGLGVGRSIVGSLVGSAGGAIANTGLNAIASWVLDGTKAALQDVANVISAATSPNLTGTWFSATYWRVAGLAALLMVPFVFAAALQALLRSDPALLAKVVFAYVPLAALAISLAAPVTMLLLSATDQMCNVVSGAALAGGAHFLDQAAIVAGGLSGVAGSPFLAVVVGMLTLAAAVGLSVELLIREAAVYVVVLMLPLAFASFVWPARRIWAIRMVELLVSLILSKFVIVAVLSLAGSAFVSGGAGVSELLTAMALVLLSTFSPWVLLRILPFTELAAGAAGALRQELPSAGERAATMAGSGISVASDAATALPAMLRSHADQAGQGHSRDTTPPMPTGQSGAWAAGQTTAAGQAAGQGFASEPSGAPAPAPAPAPAGASQPQTTGSASTYSHPLAQQLDAGQLLDLGPGDWWKDDE